MRTDRLIKYDFSEFERIMGSIKGNGPSNMLMNDLKNELNRFFKDSRCIDAIYTQNTDKLFFGMSVIPAITGDDVPRILQSDEPIRLDNYYLELDSRLFSPDLGLSTKELTAILLHEVGHVVNDTKPIDDVRKGIDTYMAVNGETLSISDSVHYREILAFGIKDSVRKFVSLFEIKDDELLADEFVYNCGYGKHLESAFQRLLSNSKMVNRHVDDRLIVLSWTLRLYKDLKVKRIPAIRLLNRSKQLSPSRLEKREIENVIRRLNRIDDDALMESVLDDMRNKYSATLKQIKVRGIKSLEDDYWEYSMRARNVEDEEDALYLIRAINNRLSIIEDYVATEKLDEKEAKRWYQLIDKYEDLRERIAKDTSYRNRYTSFIVTYPDIKPNNY